MIQVPISNIPNQTFSITDGGFRHNITIKEANGVMALTIETDEETLIQGQKMVSREPLIPYRYLERGNFAMITLNDDLPYYDQFGVSQFLYYLTPEDLEAARA